MRKLLSNRKLGRIYNPESTLGILFALRRSETKMFRITKAFENDRTSIYKIEGKVTDENLVDWNQEIDSITLNSGRQVILDLSQIWYISSNAIEILLKHILDHVYILNCGMQIRNVL